MNDKPFLVFSSLLRYASLILVMVLLFAWPCRAQTTLEDVQLRVETRYDNVDQGRVRDRLQGAIRLGLRANFNNVFDLVTFLTTGDKYTSRWSTFRNYAGAEIPDPLNLHLRQVYLQVLRDDFRIQAGAIPPVKNVVSPTGLEPVGWIDGARFEWFNASNGTVELVIGRLGSLDTPNAFARPLPFIDPSILNYFELEISQQVGTHFRIEASAEHFIEPYIRGEIRFIAKRGIEAFAEALFNLDHEAINTGRYTIVQQASTCTYLHDKPCL